MTRADSSDFVRNLSLEKRFSEHIRKILGLQFFIQDEDLDKRCATDFAIYAADPIRVAVRLRRYRYWSDYRHQFTIRWSLPSGVRTEIHKIRDGLVDYMFYGFVDQQERRIVQYFIGDLDIFREVDPKPLDIFENVRSDSALAVYDLSQLPSCFLVRFWPAGAFTTLRRSRRACRKR